MDSNKDLYKDIESAIIRWSNDGTQTAGVLTREILQLIKEHKVEWHDVDFMYNWINKHSGRTNQNKIY